jgi:protein-disulfide isomerase
MPKTSTFLSQVRGKVVVVQLLILLLVGGAVMLGQENAKDTGITRAQADAILDELKQIHKLLERQQPSPPAQPQPTTGKLKIDGKYSLGAKDAPVTMVEFTDYECPFCRQFESTTFNEIRKKYIDTGKLRVVVKNLPLPMHPNAMPAAQAALCAGDQDQLWKMHDLLFDSKNLASDGILESARSVPLDIVAFKSCLEGGRHIPDILRDQQDAAALQLNGTPSFLIGRTTAGGVEGSILVGAQPFAVFDTKLHEVEVGK